MMSFLWCHKDYVTEKTSSKWRQNVFPFSSPFLSKILVALLELYKFLMVVINVPEYKSLFLNIYVEKYNFTRNTPLLKIIFFSICYKNFLFLSHLNFIFQAQIYFYKIAFNYGIGNAKWAFSFWIVSVYVFRGMDIVPL